MRCLRCGAPVKFYRPIGVWIHDIPLSDFKVSQREVDNIKADSPPKNEPLHRPTYIHPAAPEGG